MRELEKDMRRLRRPQFYFFKKPDGTLFQTTSPPSMVVEWQDGSSVFQW